VIYQSVSVERILRVRLDSSVGLHRPQEQEFPVPTEKLAPFSTLLARKTLQPMAAQPQAVSGPHDVTFQFAKVSHATHEEEAAKMIDPERDQVTVRARWYLAGGTAISPLQ
jgi:hypothetical protein